MNAPQMQVSIAETAEALSTERTQSAPHVHAHVVVERREAAVRIGAYLTDETAVRRAARRKSGCARQTRCRQRKTPCQMSIRTHPMLA